MLKNILPLLIIVIFAFFLRIYKIDSVPSSLNWDEVSHGYNAYSILKTGQDEWGQNFPLVNFRAYGDYPLPLNLYLTIPFIKFLGLNELSIRLPHTLLGTLTVFSSYFLFWGITKNRYLSLFGSLLVAIDPWHLFPSRFVLQSNLSVALLTSAAALLVNSLASKKKYLLSLSALCLGLTLFAYHTTRIFSPLFLFSILVIYRHELLIALKTKWGKVAAVILVAFFLPLLFILTNKESQARSKWVFIIDQGAIAKIEEKRNNSKLSPSVARLLYNKPVYFISEFTNNYLGYFSPQFLFVKGGTQYQFSIPKFGVLYAINILFFYSGLFILLKKLNEKPYKLILIWLLLAPIPASLTLEKFAVLRSSAVLPIPELLTAIGAFSAWNYIKRLSNFRHAILGIYAVGLTISVGFYLHYLFKIYPYRYSQSWQYGYKQVADYLKTKYSDYDAIVVTKKYGEPHEFLLFFWIWDPNVYQKDPNLVRFSQSDWFWVDRFDKFYFMNDWDIPKETNKPWKLESGRTTPIVGGKTLLITSPGNYPPDWRKLETVNFLDGSVAFEILEKI